jgi:hypothetical protein
MTQRIELNFLVERAEAVPHSAAPLLSFKLRVSREDAKREPVRPIQAVALRCQLRIEPARRHYGASEEEPLIDLFGERERWADTLHSMLWTHASIIVPSFEGSTVVDLPVPCTSDFNLAAAKYFHALEGGEAPIRFLFSGTVFYAGEGGELQVAPISWEKEAMFRLPVRVWKEMMDHYYPNTTWLYLRRDVFDGLRRYKSRRGLLTWDQTLESLLQTAEGKEAGAGDMSRSAGKRDEGLTAPGIRELPISLGARIDGMAVPGAGDLPLSLSARSEEATAPRSDEVTAPGTGDLPPSPGASSEEVTSPGTGDLPPSRGARSEGVTAP